MAIDNLDISPEMWTAYFIFSGSLRIIKMAAAMRVTDSVNDDISSDCRMKILPAVVHNSLTYTDVYIVNREGTLVFLLLEQRSLKQLVC